MRLLLFTYKLAPLGGGTGVHAATLAQGLADLGHTVRVLAPVAPQHHTSEGTGRKPYALRRMWLPEGPFGYIVGALHLLWQRVAFRPRALLVTEGVGQNAAALAMLVPARSLRYAVVVHSNEVGRILTCTGGSWLRRGRRTLLRRLYLRASAVICVSEHTRQELLNALPRLAERATVVHNGVDLRKLSSSSPSHTAEVKTKLDGADPVLLTVARLVPEKGIDTVLSSLPELVHAFPRLKYAVVGEGADQSRLQALAHDLAIAEHVVFAGPASDETLRAWYEACDVFVLLSRREAFPFVNLEAAACGKPVVGAKVGGVAEFLRDDENGILVAPDKPQAAVVAIRLLLSDDRLRSRMGTAGRRLVEQRFTAARMAQKTLDAALG